MARLAARYQVPATAHAPRAAATHELTRPIFVEDPAPGARFAAPLHRPLTEDATCDLVVVGAGVTGLTAALHAARAGRTVIVVDAQEPGRGVTGLSTGHLATLPDVGYAALTRDLGAERARQVHKSLATAVRFVERLALAPRDDAPPCFFSRVPGYLVAEHDGQLGELEREGEAARAAGALVGRAKLDEVPYPVAGALRVEDQGMLDPYAYAGRLAHACERLGVRICSGSRALHADEAGLVVRVALETGATVTAGHVLFATHKPPTKLVLQSKLRQAQSYVVAFPWSGAPIAPLWDLDHPYHYVRTAKTASGERYLVVGGEDHEPGRADANDARFVRLESFAAERFGVSGIGRRWSSQVAESVDGLPFVGPEASGSRVLVATGFAGDGLVFGTVAGMLAADLVEGRPSAWAPLYASTRTLPVNRLPAWLKQAAHGPLSLLGGRIGGADVRRAADLAPGQGGVLRVGGRKLAVFRDEGGALHAVRATCTHLGCLVRFNEAERTWDCPCHGSRFGVDGRVLEGPATAALEAVALDDEGGAARGTSTRPLGRAAEAPVSQGR